MLKAKEFYCPHLNQFWFMDVPCKQQKKGSDLSLHKADSVNISRPDQYSLLS